MSIYPALIKKVTASQDYTLADRLNKKTPADKQIGGQAKNQYTATSALNVTKKHSV